MNKAILKIVTGAAVIGAGVAVYVFKPSGAITAAAPSASSAAAREPTRAASAVAPATAINDGCHFKAATVSSYTYEAASEVQISPEAFGAPAGAQPAPASRYSLAGRLTFEVLQPTANDSNGAVLLGRLTNVNDDARSIVGDGVQNSFLVRVRPDCTVGGFARLRTTAFKAARSLNVAMAELAFKSGPREANETMPTGLGVASFAMAKGADATGDYLKRYLTKYVSVYPSQGIAALTVVSSEMTVRMKEGQWFDAIDGVEEVTGGLLSRAVSRVHIASTPVDPAALATAARDEAQYVWEDLLGRRDPGTDAQASAAGDNPVQQALNSQVANLTFDQATTQFINILENQENVASRYQFMAAYLDAHPADIKQFAVDMLDKEFPPEWKGTGFMVLSKVKNVEARTMLESIYQEESVQAFDRVRSSAALASRGDGTVEFAKALHNAATSGGDSKEKMFVARQSLLHLGAMSGIQSSNNEIRDIAQQAVRGELAAAQTEAEFRVVFGAMGNMGDMSLMSVVEEYSRHRLTEVRENVPKAMRRYDVDQVKDFTVQWLARETSPDVKRELFDTIYHQYLDANKPVPIEIVEQAIAHLQQQPQLLTRQSIFRILTPWIGESKRVRDVLKAQAKIEFKGKSGLYTLAAEALPREDVEEVLADMPQLARQFGKASPTAAAPTPNGMPVGFDLGDTNTPGVTP